MQIDHNIWAHLIKQCIFNSHFYVCVSKSKKRPVAYRQILQIIQPAVKA